MDLLPEDLIADIFRRLPPRPLAVCRSVSKDLRAVIDGRGLLLALAHRVPRGLRGMFINFVDEDQPYFFSRPAGSTIGPELRLSCLPRKVLELEVVHHCNGLLLMYDWGLVYVCNPATGSWEQLPYPPSREGCYSMHLVFDPTVSLHYQVFFFNDKVPDEPREPIEDLQSSIKDMYDYYLEVHMKGSIEWPPSSYVAQIFSSRTGQWEERVFDREDNVAVTVSDVWSDPWAPYCVGKASIASHPPRCNGVYWRGSFYQHCRGGFIMRLSLLEQKYQVIKTPKLDNIFMPQEKSDKLHPSMHLGKSEHGIYYAALRWYQLHVWVLQEVSEFRSMPEWELKYKADIKPSFLQHYERFDRKGIEECWMLDHGQMGSEGCRQDCGWDSSDDSDINVEEEDDEEGRGRRRRMNLYYNIHSMYSLGFHPSKEIAFLGNRFDGFAYYLNTSKLQYLGTFEPVGCRYRVTATPESFIYTPCMDDLLPTNSK